MKMIVVTELDGALVRLNPQFISRYAVADGVTHIVVADWPMGIAVKESPDQIDALLGGVITLYHPEI